MENCTSIAENSLHLIDYSYRAIKQDDISILFEHIRKIIPFYSAATFILNSETKETQIINHEFEPDHLDLYFQDSRIKSDPVFNHAAETGRPVMWSDSWLCLSTRDLIPKIGATRHFNQTCGIVFPFPIEDAPEICIIIALSLDPKCNNSNKYHDREWLIQHAATLLQYVSNAIIRIYSNNLKDQINRNCEQSLTNREIQVLNWATKGKTSWEIATILSITERTVKFHLSNIYQKLDVINRQQAIAKAIHYDLVS